MREECQAALGVKGSSGSRSETERRRSTTDTSGNQSMSDNGIAKRDLGGGQESGISSKEESNYGTS